MSNYKINIPNRLKAVLLTTGFSILAFNMYAQTFLPPPAIKTGTLAAGDYYNYTGITLSPAGTGFSFTGAPGASLYLHVLSPDCQPLNTAASSNQNYIIVGTPRVSGYNPALTNYSTCQLMQTVQYFDGIGRPVQTVQVKGSPLGIDVVQPVAYDQFGREAIKYLPYAVTTGASDGSYKTDAFTTGAGQAKFYNPTGSATLTQQATGVVNTSYPFATTVFEASPLNRPVEQGAPGASWQVGNGHTVTTAYGTNGATDVILWKVNTAGNGLAGGGNYYNTASLYATTTTNENGESTIEYKDKQGRMVCKKAQLTTTPTITYLATYYVYDDLDNLSYVIPPKPDGTAYPATILETDAVFTNYLYGYHYDERNRIIQKKVPGKGWEYMIYNRLDQLAMTQDAIQRATNVWTVIKYDGQSRVILTGTWPTALNQSQVQAQVNASIQWDVRNYTDNVTGYNISSYGVPNKILVINYYDDYTNLPVLPTEFPVSGYSTMTKGLLTASRTAVLNSLPNTTPDMLYSTHYYDDFGRAIKVYQQHYLGGGSALSQYNYDVVTNTYDFTNELTTSIRQHYKNVSGAASLAVKVTNSYVYDHMGRKTQTFERINASDSILLSQTDYNEIGQLKAKHLHSTTWAAPFLQDIIYKYNERGWLKRINDPAMAPTINRLFSEQLNYDSLKYSVPALAKYNGNIVEQDYFTHGGTRQNVVYKYDPLNRLTDGNSTAGFTETGISYDNLGNILSLTRGANTGVYSYNGNQLNAVTGVTTSSYVYDVNGNATHDGRSNANIGYNMLNLPQTVTATTPTAIGIIYTYDATGNKLRKVSNGASTDYINGIQYKADGTIDFLQTGEGRAVSVTGGYEYQYTLTDHLSNNRVVFGTNTGTAVKLQVDDYYPFGLEANSLAPVAKNKYLYNKKELQEELGQYDYGARFYDPVTARFNMIDRYAEKYSIISPYQYAANDPVRNVDFTGDTIIVTVNEKHDEKLWDAFHTLEKTPMGRALIEKYTTSSTLDVYITKGQISKTSTEIFGTLASIETRRDVSSDGEISFAGVANQETYKGVKGRKAKKGHQVSVSEINPRNEKKLDKYDLALAIFHEFDAHIEHQLPPDFDESTEHRNYGTAVVDITVFFDSDDSFPNMKKGSDAWKITEQILQLKIKEGNGTEKNKDDLRRMLRADQKKREQGHY